MRALVLSGGGVKGAFQAGLLHALTRERGVDYDLFAGVSVGAINAAFLATAATGDVGLRAATQSLVNFWLSIEEGTLLRDWFLLRDLAGALYRESFKNSEPLQRLLRARLPDQLFGKRALRIGVISYKTGEFTLCTEKSSNIADWVLASSAYPGFLLPIHRDGDLWFDGGARQVTPIGAAIDAGADEIDVVLCSPEKYVPVAAASGSVTGVQVALRAVDVMADTVFLGDLKMARTYNQLALLDPGSGKRVVKFRVFAPKPDILPADSLEFDPDTIRDLLRHGAEVGSAASPRRLGEL